MPTDTRSNPKHWRRDAEVQIESGTAPTTHGLVGADALALLYRLAASPETANDALKLLHELQVHQVELDLQYGQISTNERELAQERDRYRAFFEAAPIACVIVDLEGIIVDVNPAAEKQLGLALSDAADRPLAELVTPGGRAKLKVLLDSVCIDHLVARGEVQFTQGTATAPRTPITASLAPDGKAVLLILSQPDQTPGP
jgi:PAS domain-containing protein